MPAFLLRSLRVIKVSDFQSTKAQLFLKQEVLKRETHYFENFG